LRLRAYEYGGFWVGLLRNWRPNYPLQPYVMFFTYGWLHGGVVHLAVNMFTLFALGRPIVHRIGQFRFLVLYLFSMIGGGAGFALLSSSIQPMVGASGALFGLAGAIVAWDYADRYAARMQLWPVARLVVLLVVMNAVLWWAMNGQLAWQTHLGGFVTGGVLALTLERGSRRFRRG